MYRNFRICFYVFISTFLQMVKGYINKGKVENNLYK
jgi:hypothetical protein